MQRESIGELLTVPEVARRLAIKESTVRSWLLTRRISKVRVGVRAVRVPVSEIERLVHEGFVPARERRAVA